MGAHSSKPVGSDVSLDDGNYNSSASSAWGECDGEEEVEGAGPIYTASGKERAGIDESTADEADRDEEVDDDDDDDDEEDEGGVFDYRSSLVDVGKDDGGASDAELQKKKSKSDHVKNTVHKGRYFEVESMDVVDPTTGKRVETVSKVIVKDATLEGTLQSFDVTLTYDAEASKLAAIFPWMKKPPFCPLEALLMRLPIMRHSTYGGSQMEELVKYLEAERPRAVSRIEAQIKKGVITYSGLWYLFTKGNRFYVDIGKGVLVGSSCEYFRYMPQVGLSGPNFYVQGPIIKSDGVKFFRQNRGFSIPQYKGAMPISNLDVQPMTKQVLRILNKRGRQFQKVALKHHFMQYEKFMLKRGAFSESWIKADGRVMVDIGTFNRMNPEYTEFGSSAHDTATQQQLQQLLAAQQRFTGDYTQAQASLPVDGQMKITKAMRYQTWPYVAGFSFNAKRWGELLVESLSDIQFDDSAYDRLVLPDDKKALVKALVEDNKRVQEGKAGVQFSDVISGKGGGVIFLLHGSPGVGKTLTAEAIAEYLHYPLYSVSVGELGITAEHLESKLNDILELAGTWNAVVLIDEADIFLERRSDVDVLRNAMVGVFLRKLEYHQGVLFLTTNRVKAFDPAFNSRINVAIRYHDLPKDARGQVWRNLLGHIADDEASDLDFEELSQIEINGREIRTVIRLALALARCEEVPLNAAHIKRTLAISQQFGKDLNAAEDW